MTPDHEDRLLIRQLIEDYASAADAGDGAQASTLFTGQAIMRIYRDVLAPDEFTETAAQDIPVAWQGLGRYIATSHVIANHRSTVTGSTATSETRCVAHHLSADSDLVMHIRYEDTLVKVGEVWLFEQRDLHILAML